MCKTPGKEKFINYRTTEMMDDFMLLWKVRQSALWNTELLSAVAPLELMCQKNHVKKTLLKEARHPMSAHFTANERVSIGPRKGDLNFILRERNWPFKSVLYTSLNPKSFKWKPIF